MKVSELIEILKTQDQELPVYFAYEYGDYWGSVVASEVTEINEQTLVYSEYHQRMAVPSDSEDVDEDDAKSKCAIVLG
jgi:hypothetical protein